LGQAHQATKARIRAKNQEIATLKNHILQQQHTLVNMASHSASLQKQLELERKGHMDKPEMLEPDRSEGKEDEDMEEILAGRWLLQAQGSKIDEQLATIEESEDGQSHDSVQTIACSVNSGTAGSRRTKRKRSARN
jgi:hypothetical protein